MQEFVKIMKKSQLRNIIKKVIKEQLTKPSKDCCKWCLTSGGLGTPPIGCEDWMCKSCKDKSDWEFTSSDDSVEQPGKLPPPFPCNAHPLDPNFGCEVFEECDNPSNTILPYNVGSNNTTWFANSGVTAIGEVVEVDINGNIEYWKYIGPINTTQVLPPTNANPLSVVGTSCPPAACSPSAVFHSWPSHYQNMPAGTSWTWPIGSVTISNHPQGPVVPGALLDGTYVNWYMANQFTYCEWCADFQTTGGPFDNRTDVWVGGPYDESMCNCCPGSGTPAGPLSESIHSNLKETLQRRANIF
jgi:hypothetical protein